MSIAPDNPLAAALDDPRPAPELALPGERGTEAATRERPPFPLGCPVTPLGLSADIAGSQKCYYLDYNGQLVGLEAGNRHGKNSLIALFGPQSDWLEECFPQWSAPQYEGRGKDRHLTKPSEIIGFDQAEASRALIEECARRGIFDPGGRMRGRGAHRMKAGQGLVLHCGDQLLASDLKVDGTIKGWTWHDVGLHERFVYTAAVPIPRPHHEAVGAAAGQRLLELAGRWYWKRGQRDARLAVGAIAASLIGGALSWRPSVWVTGGKGTGKSTFNGREGALHQLFGEGVFRTGNASAAAIRQSLKNATVPVMFDEIEASAEHARKVNEVIELARVSASGDTMHRGGQDHQAHEFTLQSLFWFSSINIPPLEPQDRSRLAILELRPIPDGAPPLVLAEYKLPALGRAVLRRMIDQWHRLEATKERYKAALLAMGHDQRAGDQFGMLLACADALLEERDGLPSDEEIAAIVADYRPSRLAEVSEAVSDHAACLGHVLTSVVQSRGGEERQAIGTWIGEALDFVATPLLSAASAEPDPTARANRKLQQIGLKLVTPKYTPAEQDAAGAEIRAARWGASEFDHPDDPAFLAVAGHHQALDELFRGKKWQGGVWKQSLARSDGAIDGVKVKFGRTAANAVLVPLCAFLDDEDLPAASQAEAVGAWRVSWPQGGAMADGGGA